MGKRKGIFITGTDTGVGKTYVAAGIASALRQAGVDVGVMKPVETGCSIRGGRMLPRDARHLMLAAGVNDQLDLVNPYRFRKPLAPSVAAELEGETINPKKILTAYRELSGGHQFMLVEGAGGIMAPLAGPFTFLDLAWSLDLPVLVIARPSLGTINHTLLTLSALNQKGLTIAGVVFNYAGKEKRGLAERTSPALIEKISGVRTAGVIAHGSSNFASLVRHLI